MIKRLVLASILFALAACDASFVSFGATPTPTCEAGLPAFARTLDPLAREWDDANRVAGSTPRAALSVQIGALQSVRRRVQDIVAPTCGASMKDHLIKAMDATIDAYVAFLSQKTDAEVSRYFTTATQEMHAYQAASLAAMLPASTATP